VLIGTDDVDHPRELDVRIADWLNENGAKADFWFLGESRCSALTAPSARAQSGVPALRIKSVGVPESDPSHRLGPGRN
jgi:hypothetical protein